MSTGLVSILHSDHIRIHGSYRAHGQADHGADISTAPDGAEPRHQRREIRARRHRVGRNVGPQLCQGKAGRDDKNAKSLSRGGSFQELAQKGKWIPHRTSKNNGRGRRDNDANERSNGETERDGDQLGPYGILGLASVSRKVWVIDDQGCKISNAVHDTLDERPRECAAVRRVRLIDHRADPVRSSNGPSEEGNSARWGEVCLHGEKVPDFIDRVPQRWQ